MGIVLEVLAIDIPMATDLPSSRYCPATLIHFSRYENVKVALQLKQFTYSFQYILVDSGIAKGLQLLPVEC